MRKNKRSAHWYHRLQMFKNLHQHIAITPTSVPKLGAAF